MVELFTKVNDAVMAFFWFPLVQTNVRLKSKVVQSFVGKWFFLEGCRKLKERSGSRFTVCILF